MLWPCARTARSISASSPACSAPLSAAHRASAARASRHRLHRAGHRAPAAPDRHYHRHRRPSSCDALPSAFAAVLVFHCGLLPRLTRSGGTPRIARTIVLRSTSNCSARALSENVCMWSLSFLRLCYKVNRRLSAAHLNCSHCTSLSDTCDPPGFQPGFSFHDVRCLGIGDKGYA
jgi:hypothetical protein